MIPNHPIFTKVLMAEDPGYPPAGWYEIHGDTGKSAIIWSLCSWRYEMNKRKTLIIELGEPYAYSQVSHWADIPFESVILLRSHTNILEDAFNLIQASGEEIGQVIVENLGFLLGSGRQLPSVENFLGLPSNLFKLAKLAKERDIAFFATSYEVWRPDLPGQRKAPLGGSMLTTLCRDQRLLLTRTAFLQRGGIHVGERIKISNLAAPNTRHCEVNIQYHEGPVRSRQKDIINARLQS